MQLQPTVVRCNVGIIMYRIAGHFRGVKIRSLENGDFHEFKFCLTSLLALQCMRYGISHAYKMLCRSACHENNEYFIHKNYPLYGIYIPGI